MATIIKNRKTYDSGDAKTTVNGIPLLMASITYETERAHQRNYSLGADKPTSWSQGRKEFTASCTVMMQDILPIQNSVKGKGDLTDLAPMDINVTFTNDYGQIVNDTIVAKFQSTGREVTGDMGLQKQYTLFVLDIEENNV